MGEICDTRLSLSMGLFEHSTEVLWFQKVNIELLITLVQSRARRGYKVERFRCFRTGRAGMEWLQR